MKLNEEDRTLLKELCSQYQVSYDKIIRLLDTVKEYEFKDRRTGIYDTMSEIIKADLNK